MDDARISLRFGNDDLQRRSSAIGSDDEQLPLIERVVTHREFERMQDVDVSDSVLAR